jgi:hypothetical protein
VAGAGVAGVGAAWLGAAKSGQTPRAGGPPGATRCARAGLPRIACSPGLLLVDAEADGGGDDAAPHSARRLTAQLPIVVSKDPAVVAELRQLEPALLGRPDADGVCRWVRRSQLVGPHGPAACLRRLLCRLAASARYCPREWGRLPR